MFFIQIAAVILFVALNGLLLLALFIPRRRQQFWRWGKIIVVVNSVFLAVAMPIRCVQLGWWPLGFAISVILVAQFW